MNPYDYSKLAEARAKQARDTNQQEIAGLPPGYLKGFEILVDTDGSLYLTPGAANIRGRQVSISQNINITEEQLLFGKQSKTLYNLLMDMSGNIKLSFAPVKWNGDYFGFYDEPLGMRKIGNVYCNEDGELEQQPLSIDSFITVGYDSPSGEGDLYNPAEGDTRTYIDGDQLSIEEYTSGEWSTVKGIKIGGAVAGVFLSMVTATGIIHPMADPSDLIEQIPSGSTYIFRCDNSQIDESGDYNLDISNTLIFDGSVKKFGTHAIKLSEGDDGIWATDGDGSLPPSTSGDPYFGGAYLYFDNLSSDVTTKTIFAGTYLTANRLWPFGGSGSSTAHVIFFYTYESTNDKITISVVLREGISPESYDEVILSVTVNPQEWIYIGFVNDGDRYLYCSVNNAKGVIDLTSISANAFPAMYIACNSSSNPAFTLNVDEYIISTSENVDIDILTQHYNHNLPWWTGLATSKDLLFRPQDGGRIVLDTLQDEESMGTLHMFPANTAPVYIADSTLLLTWEEADFSAYVPSNAKGLYLSIDLSAVYSKALLVWTTDSSESVSGAFGSGRGKLVQVNGVSSGNRSKTHHSIKTDTGKFYYRQYDYGWDISAVSFCLNGYYI